MTCRPQCQQNGPSPLQPDPQLCPATAPLPLSPGDRRPEATTVQAGFVGVAVRVAMATDPLSQQR